MPRTPGLRRACFDFRRHLGRTADLVQARGVLDQAADLIRQLAIEVVPVSAVDAHQIEDCYRTWGRGYHSAGLNFGDCFAYILAKARGAALLFVGNDFSRTDVVAAL